MLELRAIGIVLVALAMNCSRPPRRRYQRLPDCGGDGSRHGRLPLARRSCRRAGVWRERIGFAQTRAAPRAESLPGRQLSTPTRSAS
jgi:hypothetical protein